MENASTGIVYVVGPVTGLDLLNRPAFEDARLRLQAAGWNSRIPHDFTPPDATHERAMRLSLVWLLLHAAGLCALDGWQQSPGASLEVAVARAVGLPVGGVDWWEEGGAR